MKLFIFSFCYGGLAYRLAVLAPTRERADALVVRDLSHLSDPAAALADAYDKDVTETDITREGVALSTGWDEML